MPGLEHLPPEDPGDFYFDRFEVSNLAYKRFVDAGGYRDPAYWNEPFVESGRTLSREEAMARFQDKTGRPGPASWEVGSFPDGTADQPVRGISWYEAAAYTEFAGRSLPTIHHWNRVALTWASADIVPLSNLASDSVVPIGTTRAMSRFGAYDLAGNVREWCYNESSRGDRFILGGGWNDPPYGFNDGYAQSPWDRSPTNGLRTMRYADNGSDTAHLQNVIELPFRDLLAEPRVPRETFELYRKQFDYDPTPLNAVVEGTLEQESYIREKIVVDAAYGGERMTVYLFLPKQSQPPYQTVIYFPGSGSVHSRSSENLALRGSVFVPKSGRTLVFPVYKSTYERGDGLESVTPNETTSWKDHVIMWGKDLRRTIDYLETREDLDTEQIAYLGASWGAATGAIMMAIEPRLDTGVVMVAGMHFQRALPEVSERDGGCSRWLMNNPG